MKNGHILQRAAAASHYLNESRYWQAKFFHPPGKTALPYYHHRKTGGETGKASFTIPGELCARIIKLSKDADPRVHMCLAAVWVLLLWKYTGNDDIVVGTTIYKQETDGEFINTVLPLRNRLTAGMTFKELLLQVRNTILEANQNQNYPMEVLLYELKLETGRGSFPLFDTAVLLENIHKKEYLSHIRLKTIVCFQRAGEVITGSMEYDTFLYKKSFTERIIRHFIHLLRHALAGMEDPVAGIEMLTPKEKQQLLIQLNDTYQEYPREKTLDVLFQEQVKRTPDSIAVVGKDQGAGSLTYRETNARANILAQVLKARGVTVNTIAALLLEPSPDMIIAVMALVKAGGAFLPIEPDLPLPRIISIMADANISYLLTDNRQTGKHGYTELQGLSSPCPTPVFLTPRRSQVKDLDALPYPDRSAIDYEKYYRYIGHAMVKGSMTLQTTRGCPFNCAYCHKIWPKNHVFRSAENIFQEVKLYYDIGVRRFTIIDDIFNLNVKNSRRFFELVIKNNLNKDTRFFVPAGLRGDILTPDYIDHLVEAGFISFALALETASPRLQTLIKKNLNIEKLRENMAYTCKTYPQVILELFTMHGFPTETEEEARMTLDFIKSMKWIHFPYINILKIYSNTEMKKLALASGITPEAIRQSEKLAHHELPDTLPFDKSFTLHYQTEFFNDYFLKKERLLHVLPNQMKVLTEDELAQKYNSYMPTEIRNLDDILRVTGISREELKEKEFTNKETKAVPGLNRKIAAVIPEASRRQTGKALRVLLLDLSQSFSSQGHRLNDLVEAPLGLMYLVSYLKQELAGSIETKVCKSLIDFNNYRQLKALIEDFKPGLIGIRTLIFYKDFFHKAVSLIRQWGNDCPLVAGGPYATSNYTTLLQDPNIDLVVMGEGEITFCELVKKIQENNGKLPDEETLKLINGLAFIPGPREKRNQTGKEIILLDEPTNITGITGLPRVNRPTDPVYTIFTSGSTGMPKGVVIQHNNLVNYVTWICREAGITADDKALLASSFAFDLGYTAVFSSLLKGGELHIVTKDTYAAPANFLRYIKEKRISYIKITPSLFSLIVKSPDFTKEMCRNLRIVVLGGEPIDTGDVKLARSVCPQLRFMNHYGPTEATIGSIAQWIDFSQFHRYEQTPTIGKPIANVRVYILDKTLNLLPPGTAGELSISGQCLAKGYLNRPELTAEKFCLRRPGGRFLKKLPPWTRETSAKNFLLKRPDKAYMQSCNHTSMQPCIHASMQSSPIYLTGDLARWSGDGKIQFLGRKDHQVKVRGYRIEPGEIENRLLKHEKIKETVVMAREDAQGEKYLCAYIVSPDPHRVEVTRVREFLSGVLPGYMVPQFFVYIKEVPLTPNGKPDRDALPEPGMESTGEYSAPANREEKKLLDIWSEVLAIEPGKISVKDSFFEIGGHSLKAVMLINKIHKAFNVKIPLAEIFRLPDIRGLAGYLQGAAQEKFTAVEAGEKRDYYVLSSAQQRMYILQRMKLNSTRYNMPRVLQLQGELEPGRMETTFRCLLERHENLRTSFQVPEEQPVQRVHDEVEFQIEYYDLSTKERRQTTEEKRQKTEDRRQTTGGKRQKTEDRGQTTEKKTGTHLSSVIRLLSSDFIRPFDLARAPLMRVGIIRQAPARHIFLLDIHHIVSDGTSLAVLIREFMALYDGGELPCLRIQYKDYALWRNSQTVKKSLEKQEAYWLKEFEGEIPVLELFTDYPRPETQGTEGDRINFEIGQAETGAVDALVLKEGATHYVAFLAVYYILFYKLTGQQDIVIGTPTVGRFHADLENIMGMFINTLAMRNYPAKNKTFRQFLQEVKDRTFALFENQDYQFDDLVAKISLNRDASRNPLFDVLFAFQNIDIPTVQIPGLKLAPFSRKYRDTRLDMSLTGWEEGDIICFNFRYCVRLYKHETIARLIGYYKRIVSIVLQDPDVGIGEIDVLSREEKHRLLVEFNETGKPYAKEKTLRQLFAGQVEQTPDGIAIVGVSEKHEKHESISITYSQLDEKSRQAAHLLREKGVRPDEIVGIMMKPSLELMVGILAILKSGGAYLPIEPEYPQERIDFMLKDSNTKILLTSREITNLSSPEALNNCPKGTSSFGIWNLEFGISPRQGGQLAYIIYTSGSSGRPKGVMIEQGSVHHLVTGLQERIYHRYNKPLKAALLAPVVFDASVKQIFATLLLGHCLYVVPAEVKLDGISMTRYYEKYCIQLSDGTPAHIRLLLETDAFTACPVRHFLIGGEILPKSIVESFFNRFTKRNDSLTITNVYGPTECTVDSTCFEVNRDNIASLQTIPIGTPMPNTRVYIVNSENQLSPTGCAGQLYISGDGLARGYLNNPELTAEKFCLRRPGGTLFEKTVPPGRRRQEFYRTGDLARRLPDGNIEFLGRDDQQIKIRGFRVELEEVQNRLLTHESIEAAIVEAKEDETGDKYLCAYIVAAGAKGNTAGPIELKEYLARTLPEYMVPVYIRTIETIPLTPNGKIDRTALPEPGIKTGDIYTAPRDELERKLAVLYTDVLKRQGPIGIDDDFFQLGGHSLKAMILVSKIHKELQIKLPLGEIFKTPHIRGISGYIRHKALKAGEDGPGAGEKKEFYPASSAQQRIYQLQQLDIKATAYNLVMTFNLQGDIKIEKLEAAIKKVIQRHDSFRTSFEIIGTDLVQRVHRDFDFELETGEINIDNFIRPFQLTRHPLVQVGLKRQDHQQYILIINSHRIIIDGTSQGILMKELMASYAGEALSPLKIQYKDYAQWEKREKENSAGSLKWRKQEQYWLRKFQQGKPQLKLPTDYPRPGKKSFAGKRHRFTLGPAEVKGLKQLESQQGVTLYMVVLALINVLLHKLCGQEDIVVGTPTAGRSHAHLEPLIGMFVNTLPMWNSPKPGKTFSRFLTEVKKNTLEVYENRDYKFEDLVEQVEKQPDPSRNPIFDVFFAWQNMEMPAADIPGLKLSAHPYESRSSKFDLGFFAMEMQDQLVIILEYSTVLYKEETIRQMIMDFQRAAAAVSENKNICLKDIPGPGRRETGIGLSIKMEDWPSRQNSQKGTNIYPQSSAQKRLFILDQFEDIGITYNMPCVYRLPGKPDHRRFQEVFQQLIRRHEILRTSFHLIEGKPIQKIHQEDEVKVEVKEEKQETEDRTQKTGGRPGNYLSSGFVRPFDLSRAPLLRVGLIEETEHQYVLIVDMHHIICDGTSLGILFEDFHRLYRGEELPPLKLQYKDFSQWQEHLNESGKLQKQEEYWQALYRDEAEIPRLNLPTDYPRPAQQNYEGDRYDTNLEAKDNQRLRELTRRSGTTLFMNLLAILNVLFYRYTNQEDIIIGAGIDGRFHEDLRNLIGMFVNMLAMRSRPQKHKTYLEFLAEVKAGSIEAFENQALQFEELVEKLNLPRDPARNPLFDVALMLQNYRERPRDSGSINQLQNKTSKFEITLFAGERGNTVDLQWEFCTRLYKKETIKRMAHHFLHILEQVTQTPGIEISQIEILSQKEKQTLLYRFNQTAARNPVNKTIHQLFVRQVERTPDYVALVGNKLVLTYRELDRQTNRLANYLYQGKQLQPDEPVGVLMGKSVERVIALIGILKAGGAFVPLDPVLPQQRQKTIIRDAAIGIIISGKKHIRELNRLQWECDTLHTFLCPDSPAIHLEKEEEKNKMMEETLWEYVAESGEDEVTGGGWQSSYTGEPLTKQEMQEYGDNAAKKLTPLLHQGMKVLEIGCATGITMYRLAPGVARYYGTDLSPTMIEKNKKQVKEKGLQNIVLSCLPAHDIHKIAERNFDLVILNSVVQYFHGHNYLRAVVQKAVQLLGRTGFIFIGDVMDLELKDRLIRDLLDFKQRNRDTHYKTKTDFSAELFLCRAFFKETAAQIPGIHTVTFSKKIYTIENELTRYRYDVLIRVDKSDPPASGAAAAKKIKQKHQHDLSTLEKYGTGSVTRKSGAGALAYIIYTSGTTGKPKGVGVEHRALVNLCCWHNRYYRVTSSDRATQYAGVGFDVSLWEIFPYLLKGAGLHIISDEIKLEIRALHQYYEKHGITISFLPTQMCQQFMAYAQKTPGYYPEKILTAGDKLETFIKTDFQLYNNYGPTEDAVITTVYPVTCDSPGIPIGKPVDNHIIYILDQDNSQLKPVGVPGELCIAGKGLARGYLNQPQLTAEKFYRSNRSHLSHISYLSYYKTGDLARWLSDGNIEFLGRLDQQVKIRGYRIELGEIQGQLLKHTEIKDAVVTIQQSKTGDKYLCAYLVGVEEGDNGLDRAALTEYLLQTLPGYMVPAYFEWLKEIPLTPNGKIDRRQLPGPGIKPAGGYAGPRDRCEKKLVDIWSRVLGIEKSIIGIDDNFFERGGHSIAAIGLVSSIHQELEAKISLGEIFKMPTIRQMAALIAGTGKTGFANILQAEKKAFYKLSYNQERLWILQQKDPQSLSYIITDRLVIRDTLQMDAFTGALETLIARHESLRTGFGLAAEVPVQFIRETIEVPLQMIDISALDNLEKQKLRERIFSREVVAPFDLSSPPLLRVVLVKLAESTHELIFNIHHIVSDGWSMEILKQEFSSLYEGKRKGETIELEPLPLQYRDFTQWQHKQANDRGLKEKAHRYWLERIKAGFPSLKLPVDIQTAESKLDNKSARYRFMIDNDIKDTVNRLARESGTTLFIVMYAAYNILLSILTGQKEVVSAIISAGRVHHGLRSLVGFFVNVLPIKQTVDPEKNFSDFLNQVKGTVLEALQYQDYPLEEVVEELKIGYPKISTAFNMFNMQPNTRQVENDNIEARHMETPRNIKFDVVLFAAEYKNGIELWWNYRKTCFKPETIEFINKGYQKLLKDITGLTARRFYCERKRWK